MQTAGEARGTLVAVCVTQGCPLRVIALILVLEKTRRAKADIGQCPADVRFTSDSGHRNSVARCPLRAKSGHSPFHLIISVNGALGARTISVISSAHRGHS